MTFVRLVYRVNDALIYAWKASGYYLGLNDGFIWNKIDYKIQEVEKTNERL